MDSQPPPLESVNGKRPRSEEIGPTHYACPNPDRTVRPYTPLLANFTPISYARGEALLSHALELTVNKRLPKQWRMVKIGGPLPPPLGAEPPAKRQRLSSPLHSPSPSLANNGLAMRPPRAAAAAAVSLVETPRGRGRAARPTPQRTAALRQDLQDKASSIVNRVADRAEKSEHQLTQMELLQERLRMLKKRKAALAQAALKTPAPKRPRLKSPHTPAVPDSSGLAPVVSVSKRGRQVRRPLNHIVSKPAVRLSEPLRKCRTLLNALMNRDYAHIFNFPVDPVALNIPTYFDVIKEPMDLGTIKQRLTAGEYQHVDHFAADVRLVWSNALRFNPRDSLVYSQAIEFQKHFEDRFVKIPKVAGSARRKTTTSRKKKGQDEVLDHMRAMQSELEDLRAMVGNKPKTTKAQTPMSVSERQRLIVNIKKLHPAKLIHVTEIISESGRAPTDADGNVHVDLKDLDTPTLRKLEKFVSKELAAAKRRKKKAAKTPGGPASALQTPTPLPLPSPTPHQSMMNTPLPMYSPSPLPPSPSPMHLPSDPMPPQVPGMAPPNGNALNTHPHTLAPHGEDDSSDSSSASSSSDSSDDENEPALPSAQFSSAFQNPPPPALPPSTSQFGNASMYSAAPLPTSSEASAPASTTSAQEAHDLELEDAPIGPVSSSWGDLGSGAPSAPPSTSVAPVPSAPSAESSASASSAPSNQLWSKFQSQLSEQQERERQQQEEKLRAQREHQEAREQERQVLLRQAQARKAELEEKARQEAEKVQQAEKAKEDNIARLREEARRKREAEAAAVSNGMGGLASSQMMMFEQFENY